MVLIQRPEVSAVNKWTPSNIESLWITWEYNTIWAYTYYYYVLLSAQEAISCAHFTVIDRTVTSIKSLISHCTWFWYKYCQQMTYLGKHLFFHSIDLFFISYKVWLRNKQDWYNKYNLFLKTANLFIISLNMYLSLHRLKSVPFNTLFTFGNRRKSDKAKSGD